MLKFDVVLFDYLFEYLIYTETHKPIFHQAFFALVIKPTQMKHVTQMVLYIFHMDY